MTGLASWQPLDDGSACNERAMSMRVQSPAHVCQLETTSIIVHGALEVPPGHTLFPFHGNRCTKPHGPKVSPDLEVLPGSQVRRSGQGAGRTKIHEADLEQAALANARRQRQAHVMDYVTGTQMQRRLRLRRLRATMRKSPMKMKKQRMTSMKARMMTMAFKGDPMPH